MKKLFITGGLFLLGIGFTNAQTIRVVGRATDVTITDTSTSKTTIVSCDGTFQSETCYEATNNGPTGSSQGRSNLSLRVYGNRAYSYDGIILYQAINQPPATGNAASQFVFEKR